jgi:NADP-dependent 3-hydroxy acid dehydrogenase YdfG
LLYQAAELNKRIINIGSNSPDETKRSKSIYAVEKSALDKANHQLFYQGVNTTNVRFGYFDSPRVSHVDKKKMSIEYCVSIIDWILQQPHRVKEITITPSKD